MSKIACGLAAGVLAASAACGGGGPTTPGTFGPPAGGNTSGSISGTLVGHDSRTAIAGATVLFAGVATTTDASGRFSLNNVPSSGVGVVTLNAEGHVFRGVAVTLGAGRTGLVIDAIRDAAPFSFAFYRAFVRNNYESAVMQPIARWTRDPNFYLKTTVETTGVVVPDPMIAKMRDVIANSIPDLSGGQLKMGAFETGPDTREAADGWVTITFYPELSGGGFGRSSVGGNTGFIQLRFGMVSSPTTNPYNCLTPEVGVLDHEITHTMGFWHTQDVFVDSFSGEGCPGSGRPAHVRYHAAVAYSRPVGNQDPDVDPVESAQVARAAPGPTVSCVLRR